MAAKGARRMSFAVFSAAAAGAVTVYALRHMLQLEDVLLASALWLATAIIVWRQARRRSPSAATEMSPSSVLAEAAPHTAVLFLGSVSDAKGSGAFAKEVEQQMQTEARVKAPLAAIAGAVVMPDGTIGVQLTSVPPDKVLLWSGFVGKVPDDHIPQSGAYSSQAFRRAEPIVRLIVTAALAYR